MNRRKIHHVDEFTLKITLLIFNKVTYQLWVKKKIHFNFLVAASQHLILTSQM